MRSFFQVFFEMKNIWRNDRIFLVMKIYASSGFLTRVIKGGEILIGELEVYFQFYLFFFEMETKFQF